MTTTTNTPANTAPLAGDNIETGLDKLSKHLTSLGRSEGKGSASRPSAALALADAAREGLIDEDYADSAFAAYARGTADAAKGNPLVTATGNADQKSAKQQISKFRQFIRAGALPGVDAPSVLRQAAEISKDLAASGTKVYSVFDGMLSVAREQIKQPDEALSPERISEIVTKPDTKDKSEIDKLIDLYKRTHKMWEKDFPNNGHMESAVHDLADAIKEAGGDVPAMTDEQKEEAAALAFLAKRGMIAVGAIAAE